MRFALVLCLTLTACSTTTASSGSGGIEAVVAYAPRRAQEVEEIILSSPPVRACLKAGPEVRDPNFTVGIEGRVDYKGLFLDVSVAASEELRQCLEREVGALAMGRGRAGPFKLQITRLKTPGKPNNPVVLDLSNQK